MLRQRLRAGRGWRATMRNTGSPVNGKRQDFTNGPAVRLPVRIAAEGPAGSR
jgi:hypothetical protein